MSGHYPLPEQWSPPGQTVHTQPQPSLDVGQYTLYQVDSAIQAPFESPTPSPSFYQPHPSFAHSTLPASPTTSDQSPASYSAPPMQFWSPRPSHSIDHQGSPALGYVEIRPKPEHSDAANAPVIYRREYEQTRMEVGDEMPSAVLASDFVRKLYNILQDSSLSNIISWSPSGDFFVIKDVNEFTVNILPRAFKHSNFSSFVRQLNKYDFHKIRRTDGIQFGEHSWLFQHPDFRADGLDTLDNIKRKLPNTRGRKFSQSADDTSMSYRPSSAMIERGLQVQIEQLALQQAEMSAYMQNLEMKYEAVLSEVMTLRSSHPQLQGWMQGTGQYHSEYYGSGGAVQ